MSHSNAKLPAGSSNDLIGFLEQTILARAAGEHVAPITFVFGSALTAPHGSEPGVPSVVEMMRRFKVAASASTIDGAPAEQYQTHADHAQATLPREVFRRLMQAAILEARTGHPLRLTPDELLSQEQWEELENDGGWTINRALRALGDIVAEYPSAFPIVLTSNFDPLIEIAVRESGGKALCFDPTVDLSFPQGSHACTVIHFNGSYRGTPLHTTHAVAPDSATVKLIREAVEQRITVVLGYSGAWPDPFMMLLGDGSSSDIDLRWAFYEDENRIPTDGEPVETLRLIRRGESVRAYSGIDIHSMLPELRRRLALRSPLSKGAQSAALPPDLGSQQHPQLAVATKLKLPGGAESKIEFSAWALDRGRYSAVVAVPDLGVRPLLVRSERLLWDATRDQKRSIRLPTRYWLELRGFPAPPTSKEQLQTSLPSYLEPLGKALVDGDSADRALIGVVLEFSINMQDASKHAALIEEWSESLANLFPSQQPAVVAAVVGEPLSDAVSYAAELVGRLGAASPMSSTVQLTVSRRVADPSRLVIGGLDVSTLGQLLGSCPPEALRGLQALLSSRDIASIALGSPTEQAIVAAIDKIEPQVSGSFDAALLALFAKDLPSHHAALLAAYARTRRASARIEAIRHLAMVPDVDMRDDLADLWLKSDGFSGIDVASLAMHNTGYDTPLDLLLLARRRYQERTRTTQKREFDIRASAHVRAALSVESGRGAFDYPDPAVWQVAVRAGLDPWPTEAQLRQNDLENIDFWSFLATRPPTRQRLHDIFKLSARKRAVFGLCSPDEWQMFAADKRTRDLIVHCRWERPLDFLSRGD